MAAPEYDGTIEGTVSIYTKGRSRIPGRALRARAYLPGGREVMHSPAITGCQCKMSASPLCGGFRNRRPCVCGRRMDDNRRVATKWHSGRSRGARSATSDGLARQSPSITRNSTPLRRRGSSTPLLCFPRLFIIAKTLLPASCSVFLHCFGPTPYRAGAERSRLLPPGIYGRLHACPLLPRRRVSWRSIFCLV